MKKFLLSVIFLFLLTMSFFAQCDEPQIESSGQVIASRIIKVNNQDSGNEAGLWLEAAAQNSSWERKSQEAAVLTIFVDDIYSQDIILFAGKEKFSYRALLGRLTSGRHKITAVLNKARSAGNIGEIKIYSLNIKFLSPGSSEDRLAIENAPVIYARPDTIDKFSDIPLLTFYEISASGENAYKIRYTTIFTNEDGGTQTTALMARWGRATDIEWIYEIEVKRGMRQSEILQGAGHITKNFAGRRLFGNHPTLFDITVNNNFSDTGCSALRIVSIPIRADLSKKSRESVMDENSWTYRIMAEELMREGRINPQNPGANTIEDVRNYLYIEVYSENTGAAVAVEAVSADGKTSRSDFDDARLRVDRPGYKRIALKIPSKNAPLRSLSLVCQNLPNNRAAVRSSSGCQNARIIKVIRLGRKFEVSEESNPDRNSHALKPGERLVWKVKKH